MTLRCQATLNDGMLTLETGAMRRRYRWNDGALTAVRIEEQTHGWGIDLEASAVQASPPEIDAFGPAVEGQLSVQTLPQTRSTPAHLEATVDTMYEGLVLRRVFRLYSGCPAIACDLYVKRRDGMETSTGLRDAPGATLARLRLPGVHWRVTAVAFRDATDRHNTLVDERSRVPYRAEERLTGNLLFVDALLEDGGLFLLKESPGGDAQLHYPGYDFTCRIGEIQAVGLGVAPEDLQTDRWTRVYGLVTGVTDGTALGRMRALRAYQTQLRLRHADRDEMVMMNTWGDRGQDTKVRESFALAELEAGARLGITHLQLDDGWQSGRSSNSAFEGGSLEDIWDNPDYWTPHPARFPNGLRPVVEKGRELGIEVCLWFNPSRDDAYAHWRNDADTLIRLYREYGIRTFKIDGVQVESKRAETNLRRMFEAVREATHDTAVFNLDVTAGKRYGYHTFNVYGNLFLENRYTDWTNYYPHWTLRNLWMLSRYVPAQALQIEFLNVWRNADLYPDDDPLAPANVPFAYAFAVTMMAQPLAWFEATGLPEAAFDLAGTLRAYRRHQTAIHEGLIVPVGEEPSGAGWTGFQSIRDDGGYVLVFRERSPREVAEVELFAMEAPTVSFEVVLGQGRSFTAHPIDGGVNFTLPRPFSYALYAYRWG